MEQQVGPPVWGHLRPLLDNDDDCNMFHEVAQSFTKASIPLEILAALSRMEECGELLLVTSFDASSPNRWPNNSWPGLKQPRSHSSML